MATFIKGFANDLAQDAVLGQATGYAQQAGITTYISAVIVAIVIAVVGTIFSLLSGPLAWILPWIPITPLFIFNIISWTIGWFVPALAFDVKGWIQNYFHIILPIITTGPFIVLPFIPLPPIQLAINFFNFGIIDSLITMAAGMAVGSLTSFLHKDNILYKHRNKLVIITQIITAIIMILFI